MTEPATFAAFIGAHTTLIIAIIVVLALFGAPIFACMGALAAVGAYSLDFTPRAFLVDEFGLFIAKFGNGLTKVQGQLATGGAASTLATIPLFTFAGYVMAESKTAERLVRFAQAMVGWIPGGLALVTIVACAIFTTFTGASGITIVAIGGLIMPSLLKEGYKERFSLGLVTGSGSIGLLFPPALPLIVYGIVYGMTAQTGVDDGGAAAGEAVELTKFSVEKFMFAGIVPGMILVSIIGAYAVYVAIRDKVPRHKFDAGAATDATLVALPELIIPVLIILTLAKGWLQIPEAAAFTAVYVLVIEGLYYRDVKLRDLPKIARESLGLVGAIFLIIVAATALTDYFINANVPDRLYAWMDDYIDNKYTFLLALNVLLLIVGCLMDIFSAIVVVVPLIAPAAARFGIDPYHLGVIFLLNLEIGYLTPPVGLNLFISSFRFGKPMTSVVRASMPFLLLMLFALVLVTYIPALTPIKAPRADAPGGAPTPVLAQDGGVAMAKEIKFGDGGVWTPERCEQPEIKEDALAYLECQNYFTLWPKCQVLEDPLDRLECEQTVLEGGDPFEADAAVDEAEPDAGPDAGPEDAAPH